ncbi:MAG: PqqD family protein [Firmicutes bacterium]|nr:PqqD family protein [Bacillota bacterium]
MRIRDGFILREVAEQYLLCPSCSEKANYYGIIITLNDCGKLLYENLLNETSKEELIMLLVEKYGISQEKALEDLDSFLAPLEDKNAIEYC